MKGRDAASIRGGAIDSLTDIRDDAARIEYYISDRSRDEFIADDLTRDAVERCLVRIICEAISRLANTRTSFAPPATLQGMGDRLQHEYDQISPDLIWDIVNDDLPNLKADAERALAKLRAGRPHSEGEPG
ncbi:MAG TPA: HepT-like ribonuclease domain-containing protein [Stellaceae bacterium]|nr:HepT-like ribonuclease domain-containing protein [Stellaceae bacterium]